MTRENLYTGAAANDGSGDTLRQAATKINNNFIELYNFLGVDDNNLSLSVSLDSDHVVFEGSSYNTLLGQTDPAATRTILLPDASGTITLNTATQTLTNKTLQSPAINDANGNELLKFTNVASATNELTVTNAATGNKPQVAATGGDTNVTLKFTGKGTGSVEAQKLAITSSTITSSGAASTTAGYIIINSGTAIAVSVADGTVVGETKILSNKGVGTATVTPTNYALGTSITMVQYTAVTLIWDGSNWYSIGSGGNVTVS